MKLRTAVLFSTQLNDTFYKIIVIVQSSNPVIICRQMQELCKKMVKIEETKAQ